MFRGHNKSHQIIMSSIIVNYGFPVITATDVTPAPGFVREFNRKMGTSLVVPRQDLLSAEKRALVKRHDANPLVDLHINQHELDALAAAEYAYKTLRPVIESTERFLLRKDRLDLDADMKKLVLSRNISPVQAFDILIKENITKKSMSEPKRPKLMSDNTPKKQTPEEILLAYNKKLTDEINYLKKQNAALNNKLLSVFNSERKEKLLSLKDNRIKAFSTSIDLYRSSAQDLSRMITRLRSFLSSGKVVVKKLDNLGSAEFERKNNILNVKENDILFVQDPNAFSSNVLEFLKNKNIIIICKKMPSKKVEQQIPCILVPAEELNIEEELYFGIVSKEGLERQINAKQLLSKIVDEYKERRN